MDLPGLPISDEIFEPGASAKPMQHSTRLSYRPIPNNMAFPFINFNKKEKSGGNENNHTTN